MKLLEISDLHIAFPPWGKPSLPVAGLDINLEPGRVLGLVGQSGSGKSLTALAVMGMIPRPGRILRGRIRFNGTDLAGLSRTEYRRLRGKKMFLIFQGSGTALTPTLTIGRQLAEVSVRRNGVYRPLGRYACLEVLAAVGLEERVLDCYPFELSGGMRQRILVAMALAIKPALIMADEATTGLDMLTQAEILDIFAGLRQREQVSMIVISHDLRVVGRLADEVAVMHQGKVVDKGPLSSLPRTASHPHTLELMAACRAFSLPVTPC